MFMKNVITDLGGNTGERYSLSQSQEHRYIRGLFSCVKFFKVSSVKLSQSFLIIQNTKGKKMHLYNCLIHVESFQARSAEGARAATTYLHNYLNTIKQLMDKY